MKYLFCAMGFLLVCAVLSGCGRKLNGPRAWWDDQTRERLSDNYRLPENRAQGTDRDPEQMRLETFGFQAD